jgi:glycerol-3-phosphate cytidylyltransferase-like family protein
MIGPELKNTLQGTFDRSHEDRNFVPISFTHRLILDRIKALGIEDPQMQSETLAKYSPMAEWLGRPQTIEEFQSLKHDVFNLYNGSRKIITNYWTKNALGEVYYSSYKPNESEILHNKKWEETWGESIDWLLYLSSSMKVLLPQHIAHKKRVLTFDEQVWLNMEGNEPKSANNTIVHNSLEMLTEYIHDRRKSTWRNPGVGRVGLLFGDFRVGDHKGHGKTLEDAKMAVGNDGELIVVTPSKKTILATTTKKDAWDDDDRLYRLRTNPFINSILVADMPEVYWTKPDEYYNLIWKEISPDLAFLGEENHPLETQFTLRSMYFGGMLLIGKSPVLRRSGELLKIK